MHQTDILVIGSGVAGMSFALKAAQYGHVTIVTKDVPRESNSSYAQGGIAAVWSEQDDYAAHMHDTFVAGAGLCRPEAVEQTVTEGPARVRELIELGATFTRDHDDASRYSLHQEGGHSHRRILHADDLTGAELVRALHEAAREHARIDMLDHRCAVDLITESKLCRIAGRIAPEDDQVRGAYVLNDATGEVEVYAAKIVVLATGGAGRLYRYTTNPPIATGDGMAMAWRAGARVANMEFVQFHPTALFHPKLTSFLISEALRGEGGTLVHADGRRFMPDYDEREELAPRDIVARAIDAEIKRHGLDHVFLDMTHLSADVLERKFPNIHRTLAGVGIDMAREPIPVVPAAHYFCGGAQTDLKGRTSIANLLAIGEVSCTGLHGANRLASNSLLEAVVFAHEAAAWTEEALPALEFAPALPPWEAGRAVDSDELVLIRQMWQEIRTFMSNYVGIVRTHRRLKRARRRIALVKEEIDAYYWDFKLTQDLVELRNIADVADMVVRCALRRRESRGLHYTTDFPDTDDRFVRDTVIRRQV